jgi:hypothetical protein
MSLLGNTEQISELWMEMTGKMHTLHSLSIHQSKTIVELRAEIAELKAEKEQDNIAEVRSARDKALKELQEVGKSQEAWKASFWKRDKDVQALLKFREEVADEVGVNNPELLELDDVSNFIGDLREQLEEEMNHGTNLKTFAMNVHNQVYGTKYDDEDIATSFDYDCIIGKMIDDEAEAAKECAQRWQDNHKLGEVIEAKEATIRSLSAGLMQAEGKVPKELTYVPNQ